MQIISENTFEKARKKIRETKDKKIIFTNPDDELNRKILEKEKINLLLLKQKNRKDWKKQRNSGLNQVLAKIAKKNNINIGIDFDEIMETNKLEKAKILSRIIQNIHLCNKHKIQMEFVSEKNKPNSNELKAFGLVLGMPTWMTKNF